MQFREGCVSAGWSLVPVFSHDGPRQSSGKHIRAFIYVENDPREM